MRNRTIKILQEAYEEVILNEISLRTAANAALKAGNRGRTGQGRIFQAYAAKKFEKEAINYVTSEPGSVNLDDRLKKMYLGETIKLSKEGPPGYQTFEEISIRVYTGIYRTSELFFEALRLHITKTGTVVCLLQEGEQLRDRKQLKEFYTDRKGRMSIIDKFKKAGININANNIKLMPDEQMKLLPQPAPNTPTGTAPAQPAPNTPTGTAPTGTAPTGTAPAA